MSRWPDRQFGVILPKLKPIVPSPLDDATFFLDNFELFTNLLVIFQAVTTSQENKKLPLNIITKMCVIFYLGLQILTFIVCFVQLSWAGSEQKLDIK